MPYLNGGLGDGSLEFLFLLLLPPQSSHPRLSVRQFVCLLLTPPLGFFQREWWSRLLWQLHLFTGPTSLSQLTLSLHGPLSDQGRGSKQLQKPSSHRSSFWVPLCPGFCSTFQLPSYFCSHIPFVLCLPTWSAPHPGLASHLVFQNVPVSSLILLSLRGSL